MIPYTNNELNIWSISNLGKKQSAAYASINNKNHHQIMNASKTQQNIFIDENNKTLQDKLM